MRGQGHGVIPTAVAGPSTRHAATLLLRFVVALRATHRVHALPCCHVSMTTESCTFLATENCTLSRGREGGQGGDAPAGGGWRRGDAHYRSDYHQSPRVRAVKLPGNTT